MTFNAGRIEAKAYSLEIATTQTQESLSFDTHQSVQCHGLRNKTPLKSICKVGNKAQGV